MILKAVNISSKIRFKEVVDQLKYKPIYRSNYETIFEIKKGVYVVLYSFGVYVLAGAGKKTENAFRRKINKIVNHEPSEQDVEDTYNINIVDKAEISIAYTRATLPEFNIDYIRIIALILAESVAMESFENSTEAILDKSLEYSRQLKRQGIYPKNHKDLLRFIGFVLTTRQEILSNLYISSAPDETWNNQVLEKMFIQLKDMFDIEQRFRALNMSLNSIQESIEVMTDLLQNRKSQMLEWLIIALIFAEILMSIGGYIF